MIRHRNYYAMVVVVSDELGDHATVDDVLLLYLPLAHNYGRLAHLSGPYSGYATAQRHKGFQTVTVDFGDGEDMDRTAGGAPVRPTDQR